jgi:hypothetical protein
VRGFRLRRPRVHRIGNTHDVVGSVGVLEWRVEVMWELKLMESRVKLILALE